MTEPIRQLLVFVAVMLAAWLGFVIWLGVACRETLPPRAVARLAPDTLRLGRRLAADPTIPRRARVPVWLLVGYLASPVDLVPDFIPVIGYADDAILVSAVLRRLIRLSGEEKLEQHWPGTPEGLATLRSLLRLG